MFKTDTLWSEKSIFFETATYLSASDMPSKTGNVNYYFFWDISFSLKKNFFSSLVAKYGHTWQCQCVFIPQKRTKAPYINILYEKLGLESSAPDFGTAFSCGFGT